MSKDKSTAPLVSSEFLEQEISFAAFWGTRVLCCLFETPGSRKLSSVSTFLNEEDKMISAFTK
jgi:hypothetical protein